MSVYTTYVCTSTRTRTSTRYIGSSSMERGYRAECSAEDCFTSRVLHASGKAPPHTLSSGHVHCQTIQTQRKKEWPAASRPRPERLGAVPSRIHSPSLLLDASTSNKHMWYVAYTYISYEYMTFQVLAAGPCNHMSHPGPINDPWLASGSGEPATAY